MDNDFEKGYQAGYDACAQLYKKRDLTLLQKNRVFEETYYLHRPDFMSNFNPTDSALKKFIDMNTFHKNVKTARKTLEVLKLGDYFLINETGFTFVLDRRQATIIFTILQSGKWKLYLPSRHQSIHLTY